MFWFQLWREWKLSLAEILNLFPKSKPIYSASSILILDNIKKEEILENAFKMGWTIKIFEINLFTDLESIYNYIFEISEKTDWKFKYSLNLFWEKNLKLDNILKKTKFLLKNKKISARYFNKDNWKNLSSAQILWNNILKKGYDFNLVDISSVYYFWKTIWVQDINAYSKRDFWKKTDMQIWMLPPKLCQMMINLGSQFTVHSSQFIEKKEENNFNNPEVLKSTQSEFLKSKNTKNSSAKLWTINYELWTVYDPFVWLGTILIEALNMGFWEVFWSDINENMLKTASLNLEDFCEKNALEANYSIIKLNAKFIDEAPFFASKLDLIVSEWYLWEVMTKKNISKERIQKQKESLKKLYSLFFKNIRKTNFSGNIIICFPFWELNWKYIYFNEILEIYKENNIKIEKIFQNKDFDLTTKSGSLLYKRKNQLVGREIFKLSVLK